LIPRSALHFPVSIDALREQTASGFLVLRRDHELHGSGRSGERTESKRFLPRLAQDFAFNTLGIEQRLCDRQGRCIVRHKHGHEA
jgi:hypothetical protein